MKDAKGHGSEAKGGVAAHATGTNQVGKYPELRAHVNAILPGVLRSINQAAASTESAMPYKAQWILEELISEMQKRV